MQTRFSWPINIACVLCSVLICTLIAVLTLAANKHVSPGQVFQAIHSGIYTPNLNLFFIADVNLAHPHNLMFAVIFCSAFLTQAIKKFITKISGISFPGVYPTVLAIMLSLHVVYSLSHFASFQEMVQKDYATFEDKDLEEKKLALFPTVYPFARFCHNHLKGNPHGRLITDLDLTDSASLHACLLLAYSLYPL